MESLENLEELEETKHSLYFAPMFLIGNFEVFKLLRFHLKKLRI